MRHYQSRLNLNDTTQEEKEIEREWSLNRTAHANPEDYGLTQTDAYKMRLRYCLARKGTKYTVYDGPEEECLDGIFRQPVKIVYIIDTERFARLLQQTVDPVERDILMWRYNQAKHKEDAQNKQIKHLKWLIKNPDKQKDRTNFDVQYLKSIPINTLFEITPQGFFMNNPLRQEKSPSNSLHWNKNKNTWTDYASGEYGDVVDLIQLVHKLDFIGACKFLMGC